MSTQQCSASVHVVLRLKHIHHFVGVQLEHALHFHILSILLLPSFFHLLLLLLPPSLALSNSAQVSEKRENLNMD